MDSIEENKTSHFRFTILVEPRFMPEESDVLLPCYMLGSVLICGLEMCLSTPVAVPYPPK